MKKFERVFLVLIFIGILALCFITVYINNHKGNKENEDGLKLSNNEKYSDYIKLTPYCDYVMETNVYHEIDEEYAYKLIDEEYDKYAISGGCTAVGKANTYDGMIVGRNMDLFITNKPSYIVKTDIPGYKRTFGLTYSPSKGEDFDKVKEHGVEPSFYKLIPFLQTDVMNEDGLYIEINMRYADYDNNGNSVFSCTGTLPNQNKLRLNAMLLGQYLGLRCSNVEEAVKMATEELNLYTPTPTEEGIDWNFCYLIADASGRYGILEIAENKVIWNEAIQENNSVMPNGACQANYYITPELYDKQKMKSGVGRVDYLRNKWKDITCEENMYQAILGVTYFQSYFNYCQFNNLSEFIGIYDEDGEIFIGKNTPDILDGEKVVWDYDYVSNPDNAKYIKAYINWIESRIKVRRADDTLKSIGAFWESTFTLVANCTNKTMFVRFNENAKNIMFFRFADWK